MEHFTDLLLEYPNWFGNTSPLQMKNQIEVADKVIMKERDIKGRAILIIKLGNLAKLMSCLCVLILS